MYQSYFGMNGRPFGAAACPEAYFPAAGQEEALATLRYAVSQGRGMALLTAPPGTGKTLVCRRLKNILEPTFTSALITHTNLASTKAVIQAILHNLALPHRGMDEQELRLALVDFLRGQHSGGSRTVLIIDEAQNLGIPLLEEVRMLSNLEGGADPLVQIVLVGQPRLVSLLRQPELDALNQRIGPRASLGALNDEETIGYIRHQLQRTGVSPDTVFTHDAMAAMYEASGGVPRLINQLGEHALLLAYLLEATCVDHQIVEQASTDLNQASEPDARAVAGELSPTPRTKRDDSSSYQDSRLSKPRLTALDETLQQEPAREHRESCEIIVEDSLQTEPAIGGGSSAENTIPIEKRHPLDEVFDKEEVIVDQYAMMDAARQSTYKPARKGNLATVIAQATEQPAAEERRSEPSCPAETVLFGEVSTALVAGRGAKTDCEPSPAFVEPADEPAVYEVGAGVAPEPIASSQSDILVIEPRSKRVGANRGRVDLPQPAAKPATGAYRRLFTHARKG